MLMCTPGGGIGVLKVSHEDTGTRVEGIDDHLAVNRPRDLDPAVLKVCWQLADLCR